MFSKFALKVTASKPQEITWISFPKGTDAELKAFYEQIGNGCRTIDIVNTIVPDLVMIVDDEALLQNSPTLNPLATVLYAGFPRNFIYGTVLFMQRLGSDLVTPYPDLIEFAIAQIDQELAQEIMDQYPL